MKIADIPALREAPIGSKLELVDELWAEITAKSDGLPLPAWHERALDQSMADYQASPREGRPWPEVRDRLLKKK